MKYVLLALALGLVGCGRVETQSTAPQKPFHPPVQVTSKCPTPGDVTVNVYGACLCMPSNSPCAKY